jgi:hypothetical protein
LFVVSFLEHKNGLSPHCGHLLLHRQAKPVGKTTLDWQATNLDLHPKKLDRQAKTVERQPKHLLRHLLQTTILLHPGCRSRNHF